MPSRLKHGSRPVAELISDETNGRRAVAVRRHETESQAEQRVRGDTNNDRIWRRCRNIRIRKNAARENSKTR